MNRFEDQTQGLIVEYLRMAAPNCMTFHVPNGGLRSKDEARRFKWLGVLAGVPDLVLIAPNGRAHFIEVKAPDGVLKPGQAAFRDWCLAKNVPWMTARSIPDVRAALVQWGIPNRDAEVAA